MFPIIQIGPLAIQAPGLILLTGVWIGLSLAEKFAPRFSIEKSIVYNSAGIFMLSGILSGRISYALQHLDVFIEDPLSIISLNIQLFDYWGGFVGGIIGIIIYGQRKNINWLTYLDLMTPALAVIFIFFPIANLSNGRTYGIPTTIPWGIDLWGSIRHPVQIYEAISATLILGVVIWLLMKASAQTPGLIFYLFASLTALSTIILNAYHADQIQLIFGLRATQIFAWIILAVTFWIIQHLTKKQTTQPI
jgi:phosphatidylglycerol---prolipoprotein diacylglyceryl transferase